MLIDSLNSNNDYVRHYLIKMTISWFLKNLLWPVGLQFRQNSFGWEKTSELAFKNTEKIIHM